jgi:DNA-binding MarR family transcriptional regulator/GNAT superfamily N-acetyltransferase
MSTEIDRRVEEVRAYNRFYTRKIGILGEGLYKSPFTLSEVRVLYEIAHRNRPTATELGKELGLDAGYLSRIIQGFEERGLIERTPSESDRRQYHVSLSRQGQKAFAPLEKTSNDEVAAMLRKLSPAEQTRMVQAMHTIEEVLDPKTTDKPAYLIRLHQPGDMGWVIHRHGVLYAQEYGWDEQFEAVVAEIAAKFIQNLDPKRERCWIAERNGEIAGSIFLVKQSKYVGKLRLLLVEPSARGLGIGGRLVAECIRYGRQAGYRKMTLWTQSVLVAARHIYKQAGFRLVHEEKHKSFGHDLVAETWEMEL